MIDVLVEGIMGEQVMDEMEVGDAISLLRVRLEALENEGSRFLQTTL